MPRRSRKPADLNKRAFNLYREGYRIEMPTPARPEPFIRERPIRGRETMPRL